MKRFYTFIMTLVLCISFVPTSVLGARSIYYEQGLAQDLKELGLFQGVSETDFDLDRKPTRIEALIMLIRLLGKGDEAISAGGDHPFTDVPAWADSYIGYAYENGITNGVSDSLFGTGDANAQMYLTFVLRALGYTDENGADFLWNNPFTLAKSVGILPDYVNTAEFWRSDVVLVSYAALAANLKNSSTVLAQKLIAEGVFTYEEYLASYDVDALSNYTSTPTEYTAEQIYAKCSSSVFYVEVYDKAGNAFASGSGFFINSGGVAVTNYHVIEGAHSATITLSDTEEVYDVIGVYDYSKEEDWAVIQVDVAGTAYLEFGDMNSIQGGAAVFAIGSPLGLQNTITQGIISNTNRVLDGLSFIQTSAAISQGSSGGALINKYGRVIGITSAKFSEGENLGLALPISVIDGYDSSTLTGLSQLAGSSVPYEPPVDEPYVEIDAFNLLKAFVEVYANDNINGKKTYCESENTKTGFVEYGIILEEDNQLGVYIYEEYEDTTYYMQYYLEEHPTSYFLGYYYNLDEPYYLEGITLLDPAKFTKSSIISFDSYEGPAKKELNEEICSEYVVASLGFLNYIFDEYLYDFGDFSVKDLGFVRF